MYEGPKTFWELDADYQYMYRLCNGHTIVSASAAYNLYTACRHTASLPGDMAEVGVFLGGTSMLMSLTCPHKILHSFDTFEGLPATTPGKDNFHKPGQFASNYEEVRRYLSQQSNIVLYRGIFPGTSSEIAQLRFSVVHVDVDLYQGYKDCLEFFYPRMVPGGILVLDDYGWTTCEGAQIATDEFLRGKPEKVFTWAHGHAMIVKI